MLRFPVDYEIFAFEVSGKVLVCVYPFCPGFQDQVFHAFFEGRFIIFTNLAGVFNVSTSQHYNVPGGDMFDAVDAIERALSRHFAHHYTPAGRNNFCGQIRFS